MGLQRLIQAGHVVNAGPRVEVLWPFVAFQSTKSTRHGGGDYDRRTAIHIAAADCKKEARSRMKPFLKPFRSFLGLFKSF